MSLIIAEEDAIIQYILELDIRGFSPLRSDVDDISNFLLTKRNTRYISKCCVDRFIRRRSELRTHLSHAYCQAIQHRAE